MPAAKIKRSPAADLSGMQRKHLRGLAHGLKPIVQVGKEGVTNAILGAVDQALEDHELIKVKVLEACPLPRKEVAPLLLEPLGAHLAGQLGRVVILYRRHREEPKVKLPRRPD